MATLRQDLGPVTAYAYAVSQGYAGTEEEFAENLANFADTAEQVSEDAAQVALDKSAVHDDKTAVESAEGRVTSAVNTFTDTTVPAAVTAVETAGTTQVGLVEEAGTTQIGLVGEEGTTQVGAVTGEGTAQVAAVAAKGAEVLDSIPADYTELSGDVTQLKADLINTVSVSSSDIMDGFIYGSSGTFAANDSYKCTDYMDISGYSDGTKLAAYCSLYSGAGIAFYDYTKTYISGYAGTSLPEGDTAGTKLRSFSIPNGAKYFRSTLKIADYSTPSDFLIQLFRPLYSLYTYDAQTTIPAASLKPIGINDNTGVEAISQTGRATTDYIPAPKGTIIESSRGFWVYSYNWETLQYSKADSVLSPTTTKFTASKDMVVKINENTTNTTAEDITITYPKTFKPENVIDESFFKVNDANTVGQITEDIVVTIPNTDMRLGDINSSGAEVSSTTRSVTDFYLVSKGDKITCSTNFWCFEYNYDFALQTNLNLLRQTYYVTKDGYVRLALQATPENASIVSITRNGALRYSKDSGYSFKRTKKYVDEQIAGLTTQREQSIRAATDDFLTRWLPYSVGNTDYEEGKISGSMYERLNLAWWSDSHITNANGAYSLQNIVEAVNVVNNTQDYENDMEVNVAIHGIIDCGDAITPKGVVTKEYSKNNLAKFFDIAKTSEVPVLWSKGNHDCNGWENYPSNVLNDADWSEIWLDWAEEHYGIVRQLKANGEKSTWHYLDIDAFKVRIIAADAQDVDKTVANNSGFTLYDGVSAWGISQEQMEWFENVALDFDDKDDKDWGVIIALHQSIQSDQSGTPNPWGCLVEPSYESSLGKLVDLVKAFNEQTTYTEEYMFSANHFYDLDIDADFTRYANLAKKPHVICWLMGHWHVDKYQVWKGMNFIWVNNISCLIQPSNLALQRVPNTVMQNCFDVLNIDTKKRKIRIFRYGAGKDCYGNGGDRFLPDGLSY